MEHVVPISDSQAPMLKRTLRVGRFEIPYRVTGADGPWLVCLNGAQQSMASWRAVAKRLRSSHRLLTFDFPGQGAARILEGTEAVSLEEQVEVALRLVELTGSASVRVIAASWGCIVAAALAARHPARVEKLLLAGFGLHTTPKMLSLIGTGQDLIRAGRFSDLGQMMADHVGARLPEPMRKLILRQFDTLTPENGLAFHAHAGFVGSAGHLSEHVELSAIRAKTLVLLGEHDDLIDTRDLPEIQRLIPDSETSLVPDAGHFLHFERPEIVERYAQFFETL